MFGRFTSLLGGNLDAPTAQAWASAGLAHARSGSIHTGLR